MVASTEAPPVRVVPGLAIEQPPDLGEFVAVWTGSRNAAFRQRLAELRSRPAFEHLLFYGSTRRLTPEEMARWVDYSRRVAACGR